MRRTNLRSFHELSVKRNKGFSKNLKSFDKIKTEQLLDEKFLKLIEDIKSNNGFRGALNTNSRNQLLYLQPKRRYQNKGKSLGDIKESLYRGIYNQNNREEIDEDAMQNKMINYLT